VRADFQGPSGERYNLPEDVPAKHVTLKGKMMPEADSATVYDWFFDASSGAFKPWSAMLDTAPIPDDAEVCDVMACPMHCCCRALCLTVMQLCMLVTRRAIMSCAAAHLVLHRVGNKIFLFRSDRSKQKVCLCLSLSDIMQIVSTHVQVRKIVVQTTDTVRYTHLLRLAVATGASYPCLLVGPTGTGKSAYTLRFLASLPADKFAPAIVVGLSARTTANMTQARMTPRSQARTLSRSLPF
jgi:P-loop containing dynein motor region